MAYRRRQGIARTSTFKEEIYNPPAGDDPSSSSAQSLAAQAIRASTARRESSFYPSHHRSSSDPLAFQQGRGTYGYTPLRTTNDQAGGFWGVLAREAKSILNEDNTSEQFAEPTRMPYRSSYSKNDQFYNRYQSFESPRKVDSPTSRNGFNALTSSINQIGGTIGNALEEGQSMVENKTQDINQETRKMQIRRKGNNLEASGACNTRQEPLPYSSQPLFQSNQQTQLKASRDVRFASVQ